MPNEYEQDYEEKINGAVSYIKSEISKAVQENKKLRTVGANFGIDLYDNVLYQDNLHHIKYISLKQYKFKPFMTSNETLICHPSSTLAECYKAASKFNRMIYGTPFFYEISIGGAVCNGAIGGHIPSSNVPSHVVRLWIVDGNGQQHVIEGDELQYFRASFGYLAIIYQIEILTYPAVFFKIRKINSEQPFRHNNHVTQLVLREHSVGVEADTGADHIDDGKEYIDIVLQPVDAPSLEDQKMYKRELKLSNLKKNARFILDGLVSTVYKSIITGFFDIFIPEDGLITNSYGMVKAFPILPKLSLSHIPIPLEAGIYVEPEKLPQVLDIVLAHYKEWYSKTYCCINVVVRKVMTNTNCALDMTRQYNNINEVVCIDFGFYGTKFHRFILDKAIKKLLPHAYGFHLGKYVNGDILSFARDRFHLLDPDEKMVEMKNKYDPNGMFSTTYLDFIFEQ